MRLGGTARTTRAAAIWIAAALVAAVVGAGVYGGHADADSVSAEAATSTTASTARLAPTTSSTATSAPSTTTSAPPAIVAPVTEPPPPETQPDPVPVAAEPASGGWSADPYAGLGTWIDVYDWTAAYGGAQIALADIDQMAADGVQTLFVQPVRWDVDTDLMELDRLLPLLRRAHADGMRVVAWYLPDLADVDKDLRHLDAIASQLPIDGLAIDIESRAVDDIEQRNARLLALSDHLRAAHPGDVLGAIVLPPVVLDGINPAYWPSYPWAGLANDYDVWLPMSYFTFRREGWRDANAYTAANVAGVRSHLGQPDAIVHPIGGIGDLTTVEDVRGMVAACQAQSCFGASIYDYRTTQDPAVRTSLQAFRR
ncbi:MAG: hypothetical protein ACR2LQ_05535 [Acidimicrobiales bacterium]